MVVADDETSKVFWSLSSSQAIGEDVWSLGRVLVEARSNQKYRVIEIDEMCKA